jgi:cytidylate kinase
VSGKIINSECAVGASLVSTYPVVREILAKKQREIALDVAASGIPVVMEGQDIATHVLPEADFKVFLTAELSIRAQRRQEQYNALGIKKSFAEVLDETKKRDRNEVMRKVNPLTTEPEKYGYFVFDNSKCTPHETFETILEEMRKRRLIQ